MEGWKMGRRKTEKGRSKGWDGEWRETRGRSGSHFFPRGEGGEVHSKKELIQTARMIAKESAEVEKMARKVADACTDKRMKRVGNNLIHHIVNEC